MGESPLVGDRVATGGGLLYTRKEPVEFLAIGANTGKTLWQFQTGSGIDSQPIIGEVYWSMAHELVKNAPQGRSVWTFALVALAQN